MGESHTSFPKLVFFRSPRPDTSWVTAAVAVLDAAVLVRHARDVEADSRSELAVRAGVSALKQIGEFLGIPPAADDQSGLDRQLFVAALDELDEVDEVGVPVAKDRDRAWTAFRAERGQYESLAFTPRRAGRSRPSHPRSPAAS